MPPLQLKKQLENFLTDFSAENSSFEKCVIIHDYMDFVFTDKKLSPVIEKMINDLPSQFGLILEREKMVYEADYFEVELDLINNDWVYYILLNNVYLAMKSFKNSKTCDRQKVRDNIKEVMQEEHSKILYATALTIFNKRLFAYLSENSFILNKKEIKPLDLSGNQIAYNYDKVNQIGTLRIMDSKIKFEKDRALILYYFYNTRKLSKDYKTYRDFNHRYGHEIDSPTFRISVREINERVNRETNNFVRELLVLKNKTKPSDLNRYRLNIKV